MKDIVTNRASIEQNYRRLLNYVSAQSRFSVKSQEPSYIEARCRSYFVGNPYNVSFELSPEKTGTRIEIHFDFTKSYVICFFLWLILQSAMAVFFGLMDTIFIGSWTTALVLTLGLHLSSKRIRNAFFKKTTYILKEALIG